jgi:hypothetical protein
MVTREVHLRITPADAPPPFPPESDTLEQKAEAKRAAQARARELAVALGLARPCLAWRTSGGLRNVRTVSIEAFTDAVDGRRLDLYSLGIG